MKNTEVKHSPIAVAATAIVLSMFTPAGAQNVVKNPGFENGPLGPIAFPPPPGEPWLGLVTSPTEEGVVASPVRTGTKAYAFLSGPGATSLLFQQGVGPAGVLGVWDYSLWAYTADPDGVMLFSIGAMVGGESSTMTTRFVTGLTPNTWTEIKGSFSQTIPNASTFSILMSGFGNPTLFYLDDLNISPSTKVTEIEREENLTRVSFTSNSGFSYRLRAVNGADLSTPISTWPIVGASVAGNGSILSLTDTSSQPARFFTVETLAPN
jgi:hypothetical protein